MCYLTYDPEFNYYAIVNINIKKWRGWFSNLLEWDDDYFYDFSVTDPIEKICSENNYEIIYQHENITKELLKSKLPELFI
ncbi:MAG: hypothetical protein PVF17_04505 [Ignavibacteria bacterium]|jgi:hypothetical protein